MCRRVASEKAMMRGLSMLSLPAAVIRYIIEMLPTSALMGSDAASSRFARRCRRSAMTGKRARGAALVSSHSTAFSPLEL